CDGRTLTELESELDMTRFGVMKHLRVLEDANLVVTRREGREKLHFLNAVPIRLLHDRWIDKYTERHVEALVDLKTRLEGSAGPRRPLRPRRSTSCSSKRRPSRCGTRSRSPSSRSGTSTPRGSSSPTGGVARTGRAASSGATRRFSRRNRRTGSS